MENTEEIKKEFIETYNKYIKREGAKQLLEYLEKSDFFTAPASTQYHGAEKGGLVKHSINVYNRFLKIVKEEYGEAYDSKISDESIAIIALLHDLCKIGCYKESTKNKQDENGVWKKVPYYAYEDKLPYGHGEKSVYIISGFLKLTREEAMAINWHMGGFDPRSQIYGGSSLRMAFTQYPIALLFHIADNLASYLDDNNETEG